MYTKAAVEGVAEITLVMKSVRTSSVKLVVSDPKALRILEVMFWNAKTYSASRVIDAGWALQQLAQIRQAEKRMTPAGRPVEQLQTKLKVGFFGAIKDAAETIAMNLCLAGLAIANAVISLTQMII